MTKPKREDYKNDVEFAVAYVAWRRWFLMQPTTDEAA
jgi:hypothetical protein